MLIVEQSPGLPPKIVVEDVDPAIVVIVADIGAHGGDGGTVVVVSDFVGQPFFFKSAVPLVDEQEIAFSIVRNKDIQPTVMVEIRDPDAHTLTQGGAQPGFLGD